MNADPSVGVQLLMLHRGHARGLTNALYSFSAAFEASTASPIADIKARLANQVHDKFAPGRADLFEAHTVPPHLIINPRKHWRQLRSERLVESNQHLGVEGGVVELARVKRAAAPIRGLLSLVEGGAELALADHRKPVSSENLAPAHAARDLE